MAHGKPTRALLEDFILREKITHFDHERIPERIVHARGSGAHGFFELTESLSQYTKADFLQRVGEKTPVPAAEPLLCRVGISAAQPDGRCRAASRRRLSCRLHRCRQRYADLGPRAESP